MSPIFPPTDPPKKVCGVLILAMVNGLCGLVWSMVGHDEGVEMPLHTQIHMKPLIGLISMCMPTVMLKHFLAIADHRFGLP